MEFEILRRRFQMLFINHFKLYCVCAYIENIYIGIRYNDTAMLFNALLEKSRCF